MKIIEAFMRTITEIADSKKAVGTIVGSVASGLTAALTIPDPTIRGIVVAVSTALIVAAYVIGQAIVDAARAKVP